MVESGENKKDNKEIKKKTKLKEVQRLRPVIFAKDVEDLTAKIMLCRHISPTESVIQTCIDVGQDLLKVMMSVKEKIFEDLIWEETNMKMVMSQMISN